MDIANGELGPLSSGKLTSGRTFTSSDATSNVAVLDSDYATQNKLTVGSTITIAKTSFKVIGIVSEPSGENNSDAYIPLARAQALASMTNDVNTIYVSSTSAANVGSVSSEISKAVPSSTVTNSSDLANEVTGSLASTSSLANNLGKWLAIIVLIAAFLVASLLTMAAVSRRVREFGTLKALGWRSRRIVLQVMGESVAIGILGGVIGVALGFAGVELVNKLAPPLKASVGTTTGTATPGGARQFGGAGGGTGGGGGARFGGGTGRRYRRWRLRRRLPARGGRHLAHGSRPPQPHSDHRRDRPRGGTGRRRRRDRRIVRRLAGRAAPPGRGSREGGLIMYKLSGVTRDYQKGRQTVAALRGVDLVIEDRDWLAIQGPTGHGKSTLLQILGGLDRPTSGIVDFDGQDLAQLRETQLTRVRAESIGFVFQTFNLIPTLSAQENVEVALVPLGIHGDDRRARSMKALADVGLADRARHVPSELSGGQQQRVALARALVKEPKVLLADEPTGNLDEDTRDEILALLEKFWREYSLTLVVVTHDSVVARRAQRIGVMRNGRLTFKQTSGRNSAGPSAGYSHHRP